MGNLGEIIEENFQENLVRKKFRLFFRRNKLDFKQGRVFLELKFVSNSRTARSLAFNSSRVGLEAAVTELRKTNAVYLLIIYPRMYVVRDKIARLGIESSSRELTITITDFGKTAKIPIKQFEPFVDGSDYSKLESVAVDDQVDQESFEKTFPEGLSLKGLGLSLKFFNAKAIESKLNRSEGSRFTITLPTELKKPKHERYLEAIPFDELIEKGLKIALINE